MFVLVGCKDGSYNNANEITLKYELIALKSKEIHESSGSFAWFVIVGGGSSKHSTESYYYYYVKYQDGIQLEKRDVLDRRIFINEIEQNNAYVIVTYRQDCMTYPNGWSETRTILNIPKGTIKRDFKIEL